jgi:hypothetical protein
MIMGAIDPRVHLAFIVGGAFIYALWLLAECRRIAPGGGRPARRPSVKL